MAVPVRGKDITLGGPDSLATRLRDEPYRVGFFQAVRVLERLHHERQPVGFDSPPGSEAVRFHAHQSMSFPPSEIFSLTISPEGEAPADMTVAFLGLTGPSGALPRHYTEMMLDR